METLDQYQCYQVRSDTLVRERVTLVDQFGESSARIVGTGQLCNPVSKDGEPTPNPSAHLVCYGLSATPHEVEVLSSVQLAEQQLTVRKPNGLCLSAQKEVLSEDR